MNYYAGPWDYVECHDMLGSFFSMGDEDPCGVLHGDYKFLRNTRVRRNSSYT